MRILQPLLSGCEMMNQRSNCFVAAVGDARLSN
jgi:hypothetical protein